MSDAERRRLVNGRLGEAMLGVLVGFVLRPGHADSLPPLAQLPSAAPHEAAAALAALLDGATPLHCAAVRGNPAQARSTMLPCAFIVQGAPHVPTSATKCFLLFNIWS